jgi:hypothetical protein
LPKEEEKRAVASSVISQDGDVSEGSRGPENFGVLAKKEQVKHDT